MNCPHCNHELTDAEIKTLWSAYCNGRIPEHKRGGGAKPWKRHSDAAGLRCRCKACIKLREIRLADLERKKEPVTLPPKPEDMTWDAMLNVSPEDGYEILVRYETSRLVSQRKHSRTTKSKLNSERRQLKLRKLRERAETEKVWGKIKTEALKRADERLPKPE